MNQATYMPYNKPHEKAQAETLVRIVLDRGYSVSVNDGMEWVLKRSRDRAAILDALGSTDADTLRIRDNDGESFGSFWLVYGNGPGELISDHTSNPYMNSIWNEWEKHHPLR